MRLEEHTDFSTLAWVKPEIDELLNQARQSLEAYVEDTRDPAAMQACADNLHQVAGTLRMVESYGATQLTGEMETLARALLGDKITERDTAYGALMRGLVQLPDYLDIVDVSRKDLAIVLLPLLNELRATRGAPPADASVVFYPALDAHLPSDVAGARVPLPFADLRQRTLQIRGRLQPLQLAWTQGSKADFAAMGECFDGLLAISGSEPARRLWWVAGGVLEALKQGRLETQATSLCKHFAQLDRVVQQVGDEGEEACDTTDAREALRVLLFGIASALPGKGRSESIARAFRLDRIAPTPEELDHARAAMSGRNRALLDTVAKAVREDLLRVKEGLDIFLRRDRRDPAELAPYIDALRRVGDTLSVLGLATSARSVVEQRGVVADIVEGKREGRPETILDVASSLLYVDASLDMHIEALGYEAAEDAASAALPVAEARRIMRALLREAGANLAKVKADITAFIESSWSHEHLNDVPRQLGEVSGALRILNLEPPAEVVEGIDRYVGNELLVDRRVPTVEEMDTLADAIAGVEYYLEIGRDASASDERILDSARRSLERLHYWPVPPARDVAAVAEPTAAPVEAKAAIEAAAPVTEQVAPVAAPVEAPVAEVVPGVGPGKWVDVEEEVLEPIAGGQAAVDTSFQDAAGIDEEIREVFVEEVAEEISNIGTNLPAWKAHPEDLEALKNVRRSFHTLKGSGRLVGAMALGEFSWKIENMLNRVLDHTIQPEAHVLELVETAVAALPKLESGLKGEPVAIDPPLDAIMQTADKLAAGETAHVADFTQGYHKVMRTVRRWVPTEAPAPTPAPAVVEAPAPVALTSPVSGLPLIDPILLDVLRTEVAQHVAGMRDYLARNANFDAPADDDLVRAVHTLHGAIGMVGIEALDAVLAPAEVWVRRVRSAGAPLDHEASDALRDTAALTEHVLAQFDAPAPDVPDTTALAERIHALRDQWPEAVPASAAAHAAEMERLEAEQAEHDRAAAEQAEHDRAAAEQAEHDRAAAEQAEHDRAAAEQAEHDRAAAEQAEHDRAAAEQAEHDRAAAEQAEAERVAAEQAEAERAEAERVAAEQAEAERAAAEQAEAERVAAEQAEAERIAAEQAEAERVAAEQAEQERLAAEQAEAERIAAEQAEAERIAAEKAEQERIAARRREAEVQLAKEALPAFPDDVQPEGALDSSLDMELVGLFTEEGNELLDDSDRLLATLHGEPDNIDCVRGLQRNLHTIKGGARVVGLASIGDLGHAMETVLEKAGDRGGALEPIEMDALERGFDRLHDLVARVERGKAVAAPVNAIERFNALAEGRAVAATPGTETPTPAAIEPAVPVVEAAVTPAEAPVAAQALEPVVEEPAVEEPVVAQMAEPVLAEGETAVEAVRPAQPAPPPRIAPKFAETEVRAPSELIRVRSDLLDSMVNAAGEVSIYRARLEQQVSSFRFNLVELDQTVSRLREQLRKLEIETETQILSRYQRENEGAEGATFDPLELDRFSNLQQYSRALAESVSDLASIQDILDDQTRKSETLLLQQSRVNSDLQDGLMRTRMVPFESLVPNLRRTLRGAADELGKRAQLRVEGAQGEMDRNVLERMKAPFEHMLRNALTHGIEAPAQRIALGKPAEGTVTIQVGREGTEVLVDVADDGSGFNRAAIREKAIQRGLLKADAKVSDSELLNFVLETGFSTAGEVSMLAGRGVGMDVVANEVRELGGSLSIESEEGRGTTFHIRLPFTLAVTQAITVRAGDATFAVPMTSIEAASRIRRTEMEQRIASGDLTLSHVGQDYRLYDLSQLLGMPSTAMVEDSAGHLPLLMVRQGDLRAAIRVDVVIGSREIVVKPVGPQISNVPGIFGATIMGDGSVMLILDLAPLVRRFAAKQAEAAEREAAIAAGLEVEAPVAPTPVEVPERAGPRLVMVVDDSITMRKVTTRVFERELMEVVTAKDGVDALEKLQERVPDVMLLDIEMPRMDGYELATHMKNDARFRNIPIIMITSRTGEKHRQRAFEIGVDRYLGKPYSEADLLQNVAELLEPVHD